MGHNQTKSLNGLSLEDQLQICSVLDLARDWSTLLQCLSTNQTACCPFVLYFNFLKKFVGYLTKIIKKKITKKRCNTTSTFLH